jgi:hypothetical protein
MGAKHLDSRDIGGCAEVLVAKINKWVTKYVKRCEAK